MMMTRSAFSPFVRRLSIYIGVLAAIILPSACDVHEFPEEWETPEVPFILNLECNISNPVFQEIDYSFSRTTADPAASSTNPAPAFPHDIRYKVSVFNVQSARAEVRHPDTTFVFSGPASENMKFTAVLPLEEGLYDFYAWGDFVPANTQADNYYNTSDFANITLADRENHIGNPPYRDAFRGYEQVRVSKRAPIEDGVARNEADVTLVRPLGMFKFISTDYEAFLGIEKDKVASRNEAQTTDKQNGPEDNRVVSLADYRVVFRYTGFMPSAFNMFTDKPADAWTGQSFEGKLTPISATEVELGFDYVFVNGKNTSVSVAVEIYDKEGNLIGNSPVIEVPLLRSQQTLVRGKFLTTQTGGSLGIDTEFDGAYDIQIR